MFKSLIRGSEGKGEMKVYDDLAFSLLSLVYTPLEITNVTGLCDPKLGENKNLQ